MLNITWGREFTEQFFAGDLYPRWLFGLSQGAGSPVFYFYGPLPFWISAIFGKLLCAGCDPERSLMIGPCVLLALSGIGFYYWARLYARPPAALLAGILYLFLPYHFGIDLWLRLTLGELAAYVWMPVILLGLAKASTSTGYLVLAAAGYAGLIYSHLPSALLFSPVMLLFVLIRDGRPRFIVLPVVLGIGLAASYLVPALTTQDYINASAWWNNPGYDGRNWLWLDGRDAISSAASRFADLVLLALLAPTALGFIIGLGLVSGGEGRSRMTLFIALSLAYAWFLMTYPSSFLWEQVALLRTVQFPWRVGIVVDLCAATLFAIWLESTLARKRLFKTTLCLATIALSAYYAINAKVMHGTLLRTQEAGVVEVLRRDIARGHDTAEYRTTWSIRSGEVLSFDGLADKLGGTPDAGLVSGEGTVRIARQELGRQRPGRLSVVVEATTPVRLRFRRFYYPGWHLTGERGGEPFEINASKPLGLVEARLPSGTHRLILERRPIKEERIGAIISAASLIACLVLLARVFVQKRESRSAAPAA